MRIAPDVGKPHRGAYCRIIGVRSLLFLNRKTEKPKPVYLRVVARHVALPLSFGSVALDPGPGSGLDSGSRFGFGFGFGFGSGSGSGYSFGPGRSYSSGSGSGSAFLLPLVLVLALALWLSAI